MATNTQDLDFLTREVLARLTNGNLDMLARRIAAVIGPTESMAQQQSLNLLQCSMLIAPKTLAAKLGEDRDRYIPDLDAAMSTTLNNLAAQATSTPITLSASSDEPIPRVFIFDEIELDATTSFSSIVMNIIVGGVRVARLSGSQLNPSTDNACVTRALCGLKVCIGALQDFTVSFTNVGAAALGAGASVRAHGRIAFPGDPDFSGCWGEECQNRGLGFSIATGGACNCK